MRGPNANGVLRMMTSPALMSRHAIRFLPSIASGALICKQTLTRGFHLGSSFIIPSLTCTGDMEDVPKNTIAPKYQIEMALDEEWIVLNWEEFVLFTVYYTHDYYTTCENSLPEP